MIIRDPKELNYFVNLAIASAKIKKIIIQQEHGVFSLRPQLHLIISGDKSSFKSTVLNQVAKHFDTSPYTDISMPSLIGSVDKQTREFVEGAGWQSRNGVLILDEHEFTNSKGYPKDIVNVLLQLTEGEQKYKRKTSIAPLRAINKKDGDLYCKANKGTIEVKTNFTLMIGTMSHLNFRNAKLDALKSRCLPIVWKPEPKVLLNVMSGLPIFSYENLLCEDTVFINKHRNKGKTALQFVECVNINLETYQKIKTFVEANIKDYSLYPRIVGDCCRIYAITKCIDLGLFLKVLDLKGSSKK